MPEDIDLFARPAGAAPAAGPVRAASGKEDSGGDIIHISMAGTTAIVLALLFAVALPVFGFTPVTQKSSFFVLCAAAFCGIGYLYYLNYKVHRLVSDHARLNEVLVNSLGQGFLSFGPSGICGKGYSQACVDLLQSEPAGKHIMDVLHVPEEGRDDFKDWLDVLFMPNHALGFNDVVNFFPQLFAHSEGRRITLVYRPIYAKAGVLARVVLIATDETEEYEAQELARQRQEYADMVCRIFQERNQFLATVTHIRRFIEEAALPVTRDTAAPLLRLLHTLKAAVKHFHFNRLGDTIHALESQLRDESITSDAQFTDVLMMGRKRVSDELKAALEDIKDLVGVDYDQRGNMHEIEENALYSFALVMNVSGVSRDVVDHYLRFIVAVPVQECLRQFERELADLAEFVGKQIKPVRYTGSNPPVLTRTLHSLLFSMTHIARNIIDHGIEPAVTRLARGKDPAGQVMIHTDIENAAEGERQWLLISIADDGGGIDPARVRAKLAASDPNGAWRAQDDHAVIQNIFSWGFSTRDSVTDLSGRGVGMEAVEREVKELGGSIEVFSEMFQGTRFEIRVPYTLQI
ncbi:MAG: Hpt domain-containing protein [Alphaproteobacteria bacterium]|nr:Hpt domain-containing protein [Alphaproteobacteria bacterium]